MRKPVYRIQITLLREPWFKDTREELDQLADAVNNTTPPQFKMQTIGEIEFGFRSFRRFENLLPQITKDLKRDIEKIEKKLKLLNL